MKMRDNKKNPSEQEEPIITDVTQFSQAALDEHADAKGDDE